MPIRLAIGFPEPYLLPDTYPTADDALTTAKQWFETWEDKVSISVWETERRMGKANGTYIDAVTPYSWQGLRTADRLTFYPAGAELTEPIPIMEPARFSEVEYRNFLDGITEETDFRDFGPFLIDGNYFLRICGTSVQVIATPTGGHFNSDNFLANGPPKGGIAPPFKWIYKAVPNGLSDTLIPFTSPLSAEHTFPDLIPGLLYTYMVTDADEELEAYADG